MDRLNLAEVSFKLPNAPEGSLVRMTFWQFAYTAATAAGGFSLYVKPVDGLPYVHLCACQHSQHPREDKPRRYVSPVARLLEDATRGKVVTYKAGDRFDLRPHAIELTNGTGREATTAAVRGHLRRILTASNHPCRRDYMRLLKALQARCKDGSETYRRAFQLAEEAKRNRRESETPSIRLEARP